MSPEKISRELTRTLLYMVFFTVLGFSLFLAPHISWDQILIAIFKALISVVFAWFFFLMIADSLVKSISATVADLQEERKKGGLLYHFIKPADNEVIFEPKKSKKSKKSKK